MKKIHILFVLLGLFFLQLTAGVTAHKKTVADSYNFYFSTPDHQPKDSVPDSIGKPLIVFLHGASLCGGSMERVLRYGSIDAINKGRKIDAYVLAPHNPGGAWSPKKIMKLIDWACKKYNVDKNRIYVTGMSLGGYGTLDMVAAYPDKIAAAAAFCGGSTASIDRLKQLSEVPLWIVHGIADRAVSVKESDKIADIIKSVSPDAPRLTYDRIPGMNHGKPARLFYHPDMYDWLLSHSLTDSARVKNPTPQVTDNLWRSAYQNLTIPKTTNKKTTKHKTTRKKRKSRK